MDDEEDDDDAQRDEVGAENDDEGDEDYSAEGNPRVVPPVPPVPARLNIAGANANAKPQVNGVGH